jgi:hypothetical protein
MAKVIIIARKTDGLILCENAEESLESSNLLFVSQKTRDLLTKIYNKTGNCSVIDDAQDYTIK